MTANMFEQGGFDEMLGQALKGHSEPVPTDFTHRVFLRLEQADRQRILARVVLHERLAIAACVAVAALAVFVAVAIPGPAASAFERVAGGVVEQSETFVERMPQMLQALGGQWRSVLVVVAAVGLCVYGLVDLLFGDRLRTI